MKLKTLKDLEVFWDSNADRTDKISTVATIDLKAEAIKWVKELEEHQSSFRRSCRNYPTIKAGLESQVAILMKFFNITSEDLK